MASSRGTAEPVPLTPIYDNMNNQNKIIIKCSSGHEIEKEISKEELDWEIVEADEREMGTEFLHEADLPIECEQCGKELTVSLRIWEYPEGILNMQEITVDDGEIIEECDLAALWES